MFELEVHGGRPFESGLEVDAARNIRGNWVYTVLVVAMQSCIVD